MNRTLPDGAGLTGARVVPMSRSKYGPVEETDLRSRESPFGDARGVQLSAFGHLVAKTSRTAQKVAIDASKRILQRELQPWLQEVLG
jgi:hypothetical protein